MTTVSSNPPLRPDSKYLHPTDLYLTPHDFTKSIYMKILASFPFLRERSISIIAFYRKILYRNNQSTYMRGKFLLKWFYLVNDIACIVGKRAGRRPDFGEFCRINGVDLSVYKSLSALIVSYLKNGRCAFEYREFKRDLEIFFGQKTANFEVLFNRLFERLEKKWSAFATLKSGRGRFDMQVACKIESEG